MHAQRTPGLPADESDKRVIKTREDRARRIARRQGFLIRKSRLRGPTNIDNHGGYMFLDFERNYPVAGVRFDLTLEDVERFLADDSEGEPS